VRYYNTSFGSRSHQDFRIVKTADLRFIRGLKINCGLPSPYSPHNSLIQIRVSLKSDSHLV